jgi:pimeloyl-ACP methyl ester carboxylesterase
MLTAPRLEGTVQLVDGRRVGYAEYGPPHGRPVLWFHGSPGARRQVPPAARRAAYEMNVRIVSVERPGVGASTPHLHHSILSYADDIEDFTTRLGIEKFGIIALSGGGPYALACAYRLPDAVIGAAVLGCVAPTSGSDAPGGGVVGLTKPFHIPLRVLREPLGWSLWALTHTLKPVAHPAFDAYALVSPEGDRRVLARPDMRAMFIDDLVGGARRHFAAFVYDLVLFGRPWGFSVRDIRVPVRFWHGDADHIVPFSHGQHLASLVPGATLRARAGESHLGNLEAAEEILTELLVLWPGVEADASLPRREAR